MAFRVPRAHRRVGPRGRARVRYLPRALLRPEFRRAGATAPRPRRHGGEEPFRQVGGPDGGPRDRGPARVPGAGVGPNVSDCREPHRPTRPRGPGGPRRRPKSALDRRASVPRSRQVLALNIAAESRGPCNGPKSKQALQRMTPILEQQARDGGAGFATGLLTGCGTSSEPPHWPHGSNAGRTRISDGRGAGREGVEGGALSAACEEPSWP